MSRELRSNLPPGTPLWAARRAQWKLFGIRDEDLLKPKIAVVNSSSELATCFSHLGGVAEVVKEGIRAAGGLAFEVHTAAPSDFITSVAKRGGYILPSRDLITNDIEVQVEGAMLDGMVCLASCDKTSPGQLMAAARLNIPTIMVICGYQQSGFYKGEHVDLEEVFLRASNVSTGGLTVEELSEMADNAVLSPGVCAGMGTANSMHIVCEALGMTLPGSSPIMANSKRMMDLARQSGERVVQMIWDDLKPRDILTADAFANAAMVVLSLSGSINCVKHLQAIAAEAECDVDVYGLFQQYADAIPLLAAIRPNGERFIEELEAAGGAQAVLKRLEPVLRLDARTVTGKTMRETLAGAVVKDEDVVHSLDDPLSRQASIVIVRGSLLPGGGIVRLGGVEERTTYFRGPANIFHSREEALDGLKAGQIKKGDVVVLRGIGVRGGPGMALTSAVVFGLDQAGLINDVAVITEGQVSGLLNRGLVVAEASPEAAEGGPLALIENGDPITIDVKKRSVDLGVSEAELARRRQQPRQFGAQDERGWLSIYQRTVGSVHKGAVLID